MTRQELLAESVAEKFQRYVRIGTASNSGSKTSPSTAKQLVLAGMLREELTEIGVAGARVDAFGYVHASLPGNRPRAPRIGLLAHLDTYEGVPGDGVKPLLHRAYAGGDLSLPGGVKITPQETPALLRMIGHDLITSDGRTLLGADNKAGVAEIMALLCTLVAQPERPCPPLAIVFTPDEEIGRGVEHLEPGALGAVCAYTVDGGEAGEFEAENFNAENVLITLTGVSTHTGTARGKMINAIGAAAELIGAIPAGMRPETTDERLGFFHPESISGNTERITMKWLLRDFSREGLDAKRKLLQLSLRQLAAKYPGLKTRTKVEGSYRNMREGVAGDPRVAAHALAAMKKAGLEPVLRPIRGGTDGARLTELGLPTPNLFTGGVNFHSRQELISVPWMEKAVEVLENLIGLWAAEG